MEVEGPVGKNKGSAGLWRGWEKGMGVKWLRHCTQHEIVQRIHFNVYV